MNDQCEIPDYNPPGAEVAELISKGRTIAVVGLSDRPSRDSHRVAAYLQSRGYRIIPVNPYKTEILGEICYPSLMAIPDPVDIVNIFRTVAAIPGIVADAVKIGAKGVWMQQGLAHNESAGKARAAGLCVVQSRCLMVEHRRLVGNRL
jgi:uncharacterized protein